MRWTRHSAELGRPFGLLFTAAAVSALGDGLRGVAIPLLAASVTSSAFLVSAVAFSGWLPWLTLALVSGVLVDRWDRRRVMILVDASRAVLVLLLAVLATASSDWWLLAIAVVAFALGTGETLFDPAAQSLLPAIVKRTHLVTANSRLQSAQLVGDEFVGPPLGGLLFALLPALPFLVDSVSFALAAVLVATIAVPGRVRDDPKSGHEPMVRAIRSGLGHLWGDRPIRTMALILGVWMFVDGGVYGVLVLFALHELELGAAGFGLLLTASAVGSVLGTLLAPRVTRLVRAGYALSAALAVFGGAYLLMGAVPEAAVALLGFAVAGVGSGVWNVITVSFRQLRVPDDLLGRVNSAYRTLAWGGTSLGMLTGGVLATVFGLRAPLLVAGAAVVLLSLVALRELGRTVIDVASPDGDVAPVEAIAGSAPAPREAAP